MVSVEAPAGRPAMAKAPFASVKMVNRFGPLRLILAFSSGSPPSESLTTPEIMTPSFTGACANPEIQQGRKRDNKRILVIRRRTLAQLKERKVTLNFGVFLRC